MKFKLERVHYMPNELKPGILYYSEEFDTCAHLCACGCGSKIRTPLGPTEWRIFISKKGPSLDPSIGNWQIPCHSHYWILDGNTKWARQWSEAEIKAGRHAEQMRRSAYFDKPQKLCKFEKILKWLKCLFH